MFTFILMHLRCYIKMVSSQLSITSSSSSPFWFEAYQALQKKLTQSFSQLVRLRLSFLHHSSLHRFLCFIKCLHCKQTSHTLAAIGEVTAGRKCTVSRMGCPSAAAVTQRGKVKAADRESGGRPGGDHFIYHSSVRRRDQTSVCMIERSHRSV